MRVMVTGSGGFLGYHLCHVLGSAGHRIAAVGRFATSQITEYSLPNLDLIAAMTLPDVRFADAFARFKPEVLIHCASTASVGLSMQNPYGDFKNSVDVCAFALDTARHLDPDCTFVLLSSAAVYGNPTMTPVPEEVVCVPISAYAYHKRMCELLVEEYAKLYGMKCVTVRIFSAYGERLRRQVVHDVCRQMTDATRKTIQLDGTGDEMRDFIHASDVARGIGCIINAGARGTFNLSGGNQTTISSLARMITSSWNVPKPVQFSGHIRAGDPQILAADISRVSKLGFAPAMPLTDGIRAYCDWFRSTPLLGEESCIRS
jgi:UDP-glucose 4-epimerase